MHLSATRRRPADVVRTLAGELAHSPLPRPGVNLTWSALAEDLPLTGAAAERVHRHDSWRPRSPPSDRATARAAPPWSPSR
ncbi:hypothetical protein GCM10020229_28370 [Kitasatospora albolonga]|uniref:hypothetical protein n=1 Tax=Kitasatospora albolonga TaxID=68173 RepID=UPI0031ECC08C